MTYIDEKSRKNSHRVGGFQLSGGSSYGDIFNGGASCHPKYLISNQHLSETHKISKIEIKEVKMKITKIFSVSLTLAAETNNPAFITLNNLEKMSSEIFSSESIKKSSTWKQKWTKKIRSNKDRMVQNYMQCRTNDMVKYKDIVTSIDSYNHCGEIKGLMTAFSNFADRYISDCTVRCSLKLHHQKNQMKKWNEKLHKGNGFGFLIIRILLLNCPKLNP